MARTRMTIAALACAVGAGCSEIPQDAPKPFVAAGEIDAADAKLAERAQLQDEYRRIESPK